jgi:hypothetical protein
VAPPLYRLPQPFLALVLRKDLEDRLAAGRHAKRYILRNAAPGLRWHVLSTLGVALPPLIHCASHHRPAAATNTPPETVVATLEVCHLTH